jgi:uncharacterized protein YcfL
VVLIRALVVVALLTGTLVACSSGEDAQTISETQKFHFLESLKQVDAAGRQLQQSEPSREALSAALAMLDEAIKMSYQVDRRELEKLDLRLGKNYLRFFVSGLEEYRLGIEAGDQQQQQQGLSLLNSWNQFWQAEKETILARAHPSQ